MTKSFTVKTDNQGLLIIEKNRGMYIGMSAFIVLFFIIWYTMIFGFMMPTANSIGSSGFGDANTSSDGFNSIFSIVLIVFAIIPVFFIYASRSNFQIALFGEAYTLDKSMGSILLNDKEVAPLNTVQKVTIRSKTVTRSSSRSSGHSRSYSSSTYFDVILVKSDYKDITLASSTGQSEIFALGRQVSDFIGCELEEKD